MCNSETQVQTLAIWVRSFEIGKLKQSSPDLSEFSSQPWWWTLKSPKTSTLADGLIERTSSMVDEIASKTEHKDEEGD